MSCIIKSMFASVVLLATCFIMADSHPVRIPECTPSCRPSCDVIRCRAGTICKNGQCVVDKCATVRCRSGFTCQDGQCVPDVDKCALVLCQTGTNCVDGQCYPAPGPPTCASIECPVGQECYLQEVQCFTTPCYPIPTCGPKKY